MKKITKENVQEWMPVREKQSHKGKFGRVLCVGGNENMGGATMLSAESALYSGAGLVTVASAPENLHALHARLPEAMFLNMYNIEELQETLPEMDTILIGPGLGRDEWSLQILKSVYGASTKDQVIIVDGDAIFLHVHHHLENPDAIIVFTPHPGEWETLSGMSPKEENNEDNIRIRNKLDATVVLKKDRTQIYFEDDIWENTTGNPAMATGGMGDTLAGMIAGMLEQYQDKREAILSAVYLHSYIGDELSKKYYVTLPSQIIQEIPKSMNHFEESHRKK